MLLPLAKVFIASRDLEKKKGKKWKKKRENLNLKRYIASNKKVKAFIDSRLFTPKDTNINPTSPFNTQLFQ